METCIVIAAPIATVWDDISRLETHIEWMIDADRIDFVTAQTSGVGTRMDVLTKIGPLRTIDRIELVAWEPPHRMAIRHDGLISGTGEFLLTETGPGRTTFTWRERLEFPIWLGGRFGAWIAGPVLAWVWRRNLRCLADRFSRP